MFHKPRELQLGHPPLRSAGNPWQGKTVVFAGASGFQIFGERLSRDVQEALAIKAGSKTHPRIKKSVDLLVVGHVESGTGKLEKAEEYGIETVQEADYWRALGYQLQPLW